ncbi:MAG: hypothetical protein R6U40_12135 [Desulfobacterales bacterium]
MNQREDAQMQQIRRELTDLFQAVHFEIPTGISVCPENRVLPDMG